MSWSFIVVVIRLADWNFVSLWLKMIFTSTYQRNRKAFDITDKVAVSILHVKGFFSVLIFFQISWISSLTYHLSCDAEWKFEGIRINRSSAMIWSWLRKLLRKTAPNSKHQLTVDNPIKEHYLKCTTKTVKGSNHKLKQLPYVSATYFKVVLVFFLWEFLTNHQYTISMMQILIDLKTQILQQKICFYLWEELRHAPAPNWSDVGWLKLDT